VTQKQQQYIQVILIDMNYNEYRELRIETLILKFFNGYLHVLVSLFTPYINLII